MEAILMVESDPSRLHYRDLLLSTLGIPIRTVGDLNDISPSESGCFCLVTISLSPCQIEAAKVAESVRRRWPTARIVLVGTLSAAFEDPLYDELVDASFNPSALVEACRRLLGASGARLGVHREP